MRLAVALCLFLFAVQSTAATDNLYSLVNQLRAGESGCPRTGALPALVQNPALERAAAELARGGRLEESLAAAGYRMTRSNAFVVTGNAIGTRAVEMLARKDHCQRLQEASMADIGIYADARQLWVVIAAPFAPAVGVSAQAAGERVLELVNQVRATARRCGNQAFKAAGPVRWNAALAEAARLHSEDMAQHDYFSHTGRDGSNPAQRVERAGYDFRATGENIAAGMTSPESAVAGWVKSPVHCANLMNPTFTEMGTAFAVNRNSKMGVYWSQEFGTRR